MSHWDKIRILARQQHALLFERNGRDPSVAALLDAATTLTGIQRIGRRTGDTLLYKSQAVLHSGFIWYNEDLEKWLTLFNQAHEFAHFWYHGRGHFCSESDIDIGASEDTMQTRIQRVEGYDPHERRELEANVYAREFLLPGNVIRDWYIEKGLNASDIAKRVGMPDGLVFHQLSRALLGTELGIKEEVFDQSSTITELDLNQKDVALREKGPILIDAGPGTGKTRALVGRISYLLNKRQVEPEKILALTFSNKAAEEMRSRIAIIELEKAQRLWMMTFHSFGLELLRRYGRRIGLSEKPLVIDELDAQLLLEKNLARLGLVFYRNLKDPSYYLRNILGAISRAKDELKDPIRYLELAEYQRAKATTVEQIEKAEKALEVARIYAFYQEELLNQNNLLDYGDLIFRTWMLLRDNEDIRDKVRIDFEHVLVDEYQDVNRASRLLLTQIAGDGDNLWVVGDARQAIYRFRGASPLNMDSFIFDFPLAEVLPLKNNYRSQRRIVKAISQCASRMSEKSANTFNEWETKRADENGVVQLTIFNDENTEVKEIANEIKRQKKLGIQFKNQAVLCRLHRDLADLAIALEREGISVLYLGDFFERSEVRDLLSLLSLVCEGHGRALLRIARFDQYQISLLDIQALIQLAREHKVRFPKALKLAANAQSISDSGKEKLALLNKHLEQMQYYSSAAWTMLMRYLFDTSDYLRSLITDNSVSNLQRRLAIYQFLLFTYEMRDRFPKNGIKGKRLFLDYVRRLKLSGEEKQLRQTPTWADDLDAVRLLTVHASKGLEFDVVYLPRLVNERFPIKPRTEYCPPPKGMLLEQILDCHDDEEECLFFVAISRAKDKLFLSHARQYYGRIKPASKLLSLIRRSLAQSTRNLISRKEPEAITTSPPLDRPLNVRVFTDRELDKYIECPRKYYYEVELKLGGKREENAFSQAHLCVYRIWQWIEEQLKNGISLDPMVVLAAFDNIWRKYGPNSHPYEAIYRQEAEEMVFRTFKRRLQLRGILLRPEWVVYLSNGQVALKPDYVEIVKEEMGISLLIERLQIGQAPKSTPDDDVYALYQLAAEREYPDVTHKIQVLYMSNDEIRSVNLTSAQRSSKLQKYDDALAGILQQDFSPKPHTRNCSRCAQFFICPLAESI